MYSCLAVIGLSAMLMGPSKVLKLEDNVYFIMCGLALNGIANSSIFVNSLPHAHLLTQIKYKIVEGVDKELDGYIADQHGCLFI